MAMTRNRVNPRQGAAVCTSLCNSVWNSICTSVRISICTASFSVGLICLSLAGCAGPSAGSKPQAGAPGFRDPGMSIQSANAAIAIGTSTRAEVLAVLGPGTVVTFDSGFEIWVYRGQPPDTASNAATKPAELVILFAPSGVVKKTRIKPVY